MRAEQLGQVKESKMRAGAVEGEIATQDYIPTALGITDLFIIGWVAYQIVTYLGM